MFLQAIPGASFKLVKRPTCLGHTDHWDIEVSALDHGLQRGKDLLVCQVAGRAKENKCV